jgi:uncharacterized membrane protein YcaP (DUF421 family)
MNWHEILFGQEENSFYLEIVFRTIIMFLVVVITLKLTSKRAIKQLSIFEMVMIIALGSAAGDPMFYKEVGIFQAITVFLIVLISYRFIIWLITRFDKIEFLLEGKPVNIIREGKFSKKSSNEMELGSDELFCELRNKSVNHLGQIKNGLLETNGTISIIYYNDDEVVPGLPIWPEDYNKKSKIITKEGLFACSNCGTTEIISPTNCRKCGFCENDEWVATLDCQRTV